MISFTLTYQKVSIWVVEAPGRIIIKTQPEIWYLWLEKKNTSICWDTAHTYWPVNHGGVAGVHMDADAIARSGFSCTTDGVKTLKHTEKRSVSWWAEDLPQMKPLRKKKWATLTATKSTFFSVDLGMTKCSHRSCERNLRVRTHFLKQI